MISVLEPNKYYKIVGIPTQLGSVFKMKELSIDSCKFIDIQYQSIHNTYLYENENLFTKPVYVFEKIIFEIPKIFAIDIDEHFMNYTFSEAS